MQMLIKRIEHRRLGLERANWMARVGCFFLIVGFGVGPMAYAKTEPVSTLWDSTQYIDVNEVKPGMSAYCLTCYSGTTVERFALDVVSVIHNMSP